MSDLIYKKDGKPFATERVAKMIIGAKKINATVVEVDGGYAIKKLDNKESDTKISPVQQEKASEQTTTESPDVKVTETWRPKNATEIPEEYKEPDFEYKFAYQHKRAINKKLREGWVIDHNVAQKMRDAGLLFSDGSCDSTFIIGDTVLMKLPKARAIARRKYYQERTMDGMKKKKAEYDAKLRACGVEESVGSGIQVSRGIAG
jgi:hypothetical protein